MIFRKKLKQRNFVITKLQLLDRLRFKLEKFKHKLNDLNSTQKINNYIIHRKYIEKYKKIIELTFTNINKIEQNMPFT
jgi:hypothetical protein